ncbi:hypothetical protein Ciccas_002129 [Cichlidogyrus casuarinus]|uniref:Uncharacterized protein n=1 Tax=Cichlidogyrus casuarinus TaxID=1844966 RepID=A0ABD2QKC4_9PLAT
MFKLISFLVLFIVLGLLNGIPIEAPVEEEKVAETISPEEAYLTLVELVSLIGVNTDTLHEIGNGTLEITSETVHMIMQPLEDYILNNGTSIET